MRKGGAQPSAVFRTKEDAEVWISSLKLTGTLTAYPVSVSVYDWTVQMGYFTAKQPHHLTSQFVGRFSSAYLDHDHYSDGMAAP